MYSDAETPSETAGSSSESSLALLLWSPRPGYFSQAGRYSNTTAGFGARVGLGVRGFVTALPFAIQAHPLNLGLFFGFYCLFPLAP